MWQPDPAWQPVGSGLGTGSGGGGVWLAETLDTTVVVKRLTAPVPGDPAGRSRPDHAAYWRREADVALDGGLETTPGLRAPEPVRVEDDADGVTVWTERVGDAGSNGLFLARALGVFAGCDPEPAPWWCRDLLGDRLAVVEERGGWPTLARTTVADVADRLWQRRRHHLDAVAELTRVPSHGDPTPGNLLGRVGDDVVAVDWSAFGSAPVGADVGYLALSVTADLDVLLEAYDEGLAEGGREVGHDEARLGAAVMACYTALTRAEWALARAATGPGALAGKYRHPAVAPHLRTLQRLFPQLESLL